MAHKVHPKIFRIRKNDDWLSRGFYENFPQQLEEDFKIRKFLEEKIGKFGLEKIEIERFSTKVNVIIFTSRPALVIGRKGEIVEKLKDGLKKIVGLNSKTEIRLEVREVKNPWVSAAIVANWIAEQIEKRTPYRKVLKQALSKIMFNKEVKGARIDVAGRLDGVEIARREWIKEGKLPRQTIRANIDYSASRAYCTYGVIGIKVWIYKGEFFD